MSADHLHQVALASGRFPTVNARRPRNIVIEYFAPRYLIESGTPVAHLKRLSATIHTADPTQLMLVFTSRANPAFGHFVRDVYWARYASEYELILGSYLQGAKAVVIEEPYIRPQPQILNFVRFYESLITGYDDKTQLADIAEELDELKQSLLELDVESEVKLNPNIHIRKIGWTTAGSSRLGVTSPFFHKPGDGSRAWQTIFPSGSALKSRWTSFVSS